MVQNIIIHVYTGDRKNAGTDSNVNIVLYDENNTASSPIPLGNYFNNDFERGKIDTFSIPQDLYSSLKSPIRIERIDIYKTGWLFCSDWFVDKIEVENPLINERFIFPFFRWIKANIHYNIKLLDTSLPQFDEFPEQRRQGLLDKRISYQLAQKIPRGPVQAKTLPKDEVFAFSYQWDITRSMLSFKLHKKLHLAVHSLQFSSIADMRSTYDDMIFKPPQDIDRWNDDDRFGMQRLSGLNHSIISLVKNIPENFPVTDDLLKPFLEGSTLKELISKKKLFLCDLALLEDVPCKKGFLVCAPIGLFYLNSENRFLPVAIQLYQKPSSDNPIFTPGCPSLTWALVKLWFNNADTTYHQSLTHLGKFINNADTVYHQALTHLGLTHLLMEGVAMTSHRHLAVSHPIFKIIAPHFLYIVAINDKAIQRLVSPGGWVDQIMNCASVGLFEIIRRGFKKWRMNVEGTLPEDIKERGLDDDTILPMYHYKNDALLLYNAIKKYVKAYVDLYYTSPEVLSDDKEIQNWAQELVREPEGLNGGIGIKGVPGNGHITTTDQLTQIVTSIIYMCSVAHAAANFPQYEEYGYPLKYPAMMRGKPPTSVTTETTERDILKHISNRDDMMKLMSLTKILSTQGTRSLGDFEVQYVFEPAALKLVNEFRKDLEEITKIIHERNQTREHPYVYMDPKFIPNSISI